VLNRIKKIVDDPEIEIKKVGTYWEPSALSDTDSEKYKLLQGIIDSSFENVVVAPYLVVGSTDSRY